MATYNANGTTDYVPGESNGRAVPLPPTIASLTPSSASHSGGPITLHVLGAHFTSDAVVVFNGIDRATTWVSAGEVTITGDILPSTPLGAVPVVVRTKSGTSNSATFTNT